MDKSRLKAGCAVALWGMAGVCPLAALLQDPAIEGGVIPRDAALRQEFFELGPNPTLMTPTAK
jgi:hypothetical protein